MHAWLLPSSGNTSIHHASSFVGQRRLWRWGANRIHMRGRETKLKAATNLREHERTAHAENNVHRIARRGCFDLEAPS